ncbi:MAG: Hsp20/alpha crystallin family protein [Candidatus Hydrogenedentes bacterium]|nr:Hsp20/alpha crystallin family protein [Candidatus Hydrogenedentota bacterium]
MTACAPQVATRYLIPRVNVVDEAERVVIEAELPGVAKADLSLEVKDGELTLVGKRANATREGHYIMRERAFADYRRVFALSNAIDPTRIEAEMKDGLLTVTLHKTDRVKPRKINVN